jgi:hypothetical protein
MRGQLTCHGRLSMTSLDGFSPRLAPRVCCHVPSLMGIICIFRSGNPRGIKMWLQFIDQLSKTRCLDSTVVNHDNIYYTTLNRPPLIQITNTLGPITGQDQFPQRNSLPRHGSTCRPTTDRVPAKTRPYDGIGEEPGHSLRGDLWRKQQSGGVGLRARVVWVGTLDGGHRFASTCPSRPGRYFRQCALSADLHESLRTRMDYSSAFLLEAKGRFNGRGRVRG